MAIRAELNAHSPCDAFVSTIAGFLIELAFLIHLCERFHDEVPIKRICGNRFS